MLYFIISPVRREKDQKEERLRRVVGEVWCCIVYNINMNE